ncbi:MAG TPA: lipid II flippase MurJ [Candidatus Saccharimonadales bacterium]|nr:lipid II flippase MurJ [Candidatus Saccharimonadales bacterium]
MQMKIPRTSKHISLGGVAVLLVASSLLAQVLGFLRTKLVNANFLAVGHHSTDSYFAAFTIPDFFFFTIAAGALGVAFMPVLADHLARGDRKGMWRLTGSLLNMLCIIMLFVAVIMFVFAEPLLHHIVAPKLGAQQLHDAVVIMRFLSLNPLLFTISGILAATQQSLGRFFFYATAPLFYNGSIILSAIIFSDVSPHNGGPGHLGITGLGIGALVGAVLQLLVVLVGVYGTGFVWRPKIDWGHADFRQVVRNLPPRSLDQGIDQLESIVETNFATRLGPGSVSYYSNAYTLQLAPVLLIGTAISTAVFPRLNNRLSQGRPDLFRQDFLRFLRLIIWIALPVVVVAFFGRGYLARLIFSRNSGDIANIFGFLTVAILFRTIYTFISRWFYAQKDTRTPLYVSIFTISFNILLAYLLTRPGGYGLPGLALAQSITAAVEVAILGSIMLARDPQLFDQTFWSGVWRTISVTGFSLVAGYITVSYAPLGAEDRGFVTLGSKFLLIAGVTIATHFAVSGLFGLEEAQPFWRWLRKFTLRPVKVDY